MSGHSKWATIKRSKGKADAARGKIFNRLIREITIAARMGGGSIDGNPRLRSAVVSARAQNMPGKNIDNAIAKGTGTLEGQTYEEFTLEGYGPNGVAILVDVMTDNRNRTVGEVRHVFTKMGGALGAANSVGYMFHSKGKIEVAADVGSEDTIMEIALEAGAEDMTSGDDIFEITTAVDTFEAVRTALEKANIKMSSAEMQKVPDTYVILDAEPSSKVMKMLELLDDLDDTQHVFSNFDMSDEAAAALGA